MPWANNELLTVGKVPTHLGSSVTCLVADIFHALLNSFFSGSMDVLCNFDTAIQLSKSLHCGLIV